MNERISYNDVLDVNEPESSTTLTNKKSRAKASASKPYDRPSGSRRTQAQITSQGDSSSTASGSLRRSLRISTDELIRREAVLIASENALEVRSSELHQALAQLQQKEAETAKMISLLADREARETCMQLEQAFLCPL